MLQAKWTGHWTLCKLPGRCDASLRGSSARLAHYMLTWKECGDQAVRQCGSGPSVPRGCNVSPSMGGLRIECLGQHPRPARLAEPPPVHHA